jgi:hypothetical protein
MSHPLVVDCRKDPFDVFIGRPSKWGNPFRWDGTRDEVCDKYEALRGTDADFIAMVKKELRGKRLGCFCDPLRCHGDWLARIANE